MYLPPGVVHGACLADLVAAVPARRAPLFPPVDGAEVVQDVSQVRSFADGDDVVDLPAVHPARYGMLADPADGAVRGVHGEAELLPPVPAPAHLRAR